MIRSVFRAIAELCGVSDLEAVLYVLLSTGGWIFFCYYYLFETGFGVAVPRYAGY